MKMDKHHKNLEINYDDGAIEKIPLDEDSVKDDVDEIIKYNVDKVGVGLESIRKTGINYQELKAIANSEVFPILDTAEKVFTAMCLVAECGLNPVQGLSQIYFVNGKPVLQIQALAALVRAAGHSYTILGRDIKYTNPITGKDDIKCEILCQRCDEKMKDESGEPIKHKVSFSWEEAKQAGLINKDNWKKYPLDMLVARTLGRMVRTVFADVAVGLYPVSELEEI